MKETRGNIWTETDNRGVVKVGFTRKYIEDRLGECFHVMQASQIGQKLMKGDPMLVMETNDGLVNLKAPLSGILQVFNPKARDFPDRLDEEDTIVEIVPDGVKLEKPKPTSGNTITWNDIQIQPAPDVEWRNANQVIGHGTFRPAVPQPAQPRQGLALNVRPRIRPR